MRVLRISAVALSMPIAAGVTQGATSSPPVVSIERPGQHPDVPLDRVGLPDVKTPMPPRSVAVVENTGGGRPSVSPDGKYIAYGAARNGEWEIYVIHPDGTGERRLTDVKETVFVNLGPPTWRDNRVLMWHRVNDTTHVSVIEVEPRQAGNAQAERIVVPFDARDIHASPDGRQILFVHGEAKLPRVAISNLDGTQLRDLTDPKRPAINPAWSPDGKRLAYTTVDSASRGQIAVVDATGTNVHVVTTFDRADGLPQWSAWSPDGARLAIQAGKYNRVKIEESTAHLWIVDVATGKATKLAPHDNPSLDETPSWFPDGKRVAFQSNRTGVMQVWVMNVDGTGARQVTSWSP